MHTPSIYLLSVGINQYQSDNIPNLSACVNDITKFRDTLIQSSKTTLDHCVSLCDEQATRDGIIKAFRSHFSQLKEGDIALFHYSGHGSQEPTSPEFITAGYEPPLGKNETLVCYDSQSPNIYNIADKEIRLLVAELQETKKQSTFVGIFDCCHSGSLLKADDFKIKNIPPVQRRRPIDSYLEGQFLKIIQQSGKLSLPSIQYLSLTACSPKEHALETRNGGLFTNAIIQILQQSPTFPSYAEIHAWSNIIVKTNSNNRQHPSLEYLGPITPYQLFLGQNITTDKSIPLLFKKGDQWVANAGAIHGIIVLTSEQQSVNIFDQHDLNTPIGTATIKQVFVEETTMAPIWKQAPTSEKSILYIQLYTKKTPVHLSIKPASTYTHHELKQLFNSPQSPNKLMPSQLAEYELVAEEDQLLIYHQTSNAKNLLIGLKGKSPHALHWLSHQFQMISKWENILQLPIPKHSTIPPESLQLHFSYWDTKGTKVTTSLNETSNDLLTIPFSPDKGPIPYEIDVEHQHTYSQGLHLYLVHLDRKYQILQKNEQFTKAIMRRIRLTLYNSLENNSGLGISDPDTNLTTDHFILIASETSLNSAFHFHQEGFGKQYGKISSDSSIQKTKEELPIQKNLKSNWMIKKISIQIVQH